MATAVQKIASLGERRDIPFNKLALSQANVRRIKAGVSVEELAEDIARRGLLQSLNVRPVLDADGVETGTFEIPAGGRRFQALSLLVKQKRLALDYVFVDRNEIEETGEYDLEGLFIRIGFAVDQIGARRVVLDTVETLFSGFTDHGILRAELRRLTTPRCH